MNKPKNYKPVPHQPVEVGPVVELTIDLGLLRRARQVMKDYLSEGLPYVSEQEIREDINKLDRIIGDEVSLDKYKKGADKMQETPEPTTTKQLGVDCNDCDRQATCMTDGLNKDCVNVEPADYPQELQAEFIKPIPNFIDTYTEVFKVTNIHFKVPTGEKLRVIKPFETFWKEYHPEATEEECHAHYVKTKLFYNYELKFDYAPVAYNTPEYKQAMRDHCSRKEFRCCADDADHIIPRRDASDDNDFYFYYHRPWMYVVIPNTYLHIVDTFVAGHCIQQIEEQMIWEYLRNTLKITVEYLYDDIIDEDDEQ